MAQRDEKRYWREGNQSVGAPNMDSRAKVLVLVDLIEGGDFRGRLFNPYVAGPVPYQSAIDMVWQMESIFDSFSFPQSTFSYRTFGPAKGAGGGPQGARRGEPKAKEIKRYMEDTIYETQRGEKTTFIVQVQFRQNATWQGTISWADKKLTRHFRSTLEMIKLMDDAMSISENRGGPSDWDEPAGGTSPAPAGETQRG